MQIRIHVSQLPFMALLLVLLAVLFGHVVVFRSNIVRYLHSQRAHLLLLIYYRVSMVIIVVISCRTLTAAARDLD